MKINRLAWFIRNEGETIATFGAARLVKLDGKIQLLGGTDADRATAREWCSLFFHEATIASTPRTRSLEGGRTDKVKSGQQA